MKEERFKFMVAVYHRGRSSARINFSASYSSYLENPEQAANMLICLIHQTNYLLDQQLKKLSQEFLQQGGFTERLYNQRKNLKDNNYMKSTVRLWRKSRKLKTRIIASISIRIKVSIKICPGACGFC